MKIEHIAIALILMLLMFGCCQRDTQSLSLTPIVTDIPGCAWTDAVKVHGNGTGTFSFYTSAIGDECDCATLRCLIEIRMVESEIVWALSINGYLVTISNQSTYEYQCIGGAVIQFTFNFPDPLESYAVGDTWTFYLTY